MSTQRLRVGVIGCGGIAQMMHLPHLVERPDLFDVRMIADVKQETLDAVGPRYGVTARTTDPMAVIANPEVDAVLLLASGSHGALAAATLERGKHLFVEKPLGYGVPETEALAKVARSSKGRLMVGYHKRFDPAYLRARELVRAMGDVRLVEVTVLHPDDGAYRNHHAILPVPAVRAAPQPESVDVRNTEVAVTEGPLAPRISEIVAPDAKLEHRVAAKILSESLIHDLNVVRGVLGEPEEVLSGHTWRSGFAQTSVSRFPNDIHATLSWIMVPGLRNYEERIRFVGSDGRVTLVFPSPYLRNHPTPLFVERMEGEDLVVEQRTVSYEEAFRAELHAFRACVVEGREPDPSWQEALGDARWIEAIARTFTLGAQKVGRSPARVTAA